MLEVRRPLIRPNVAPETHTDSRRRFSQYLTIVFPFVSRSPEHQNDTIRVAEFSSDPLKFQTGVHVADPTLV
jgi:hypothetical protein